MEKTNTVTINGRHYDPKTGLPTIKPDAKKPKAAPAAKPNRPSAATTVHRSGPQRSETLNRRIAKKHSTTKLDTKKPSVGRTMDIARSSHIARFAPHAAAAAKPIAEKFHAAVSHPMAERAVRRHVQASQQVAPKALSPAAIKEQAISKVMAAPSPSREPHKKRSFWARHRRLWLIIGIIVIILGVGGYTAYINLPGISVSFAANQAGIKATYPSYTPDGYSLQQPITFSDGQVTMHFVSNSGGKGYTINESRSSWDSSAVLENVVQKAAGSNYITTQDSGLTIYNYSSNAAWVNDGILYTITTKAPLSNEQVRNIATSL